MLSEKEVMLLETQFVEETRGVRVSVWPQYNKDQSRPSQSLFFYSYTVLIENLGKLAISIHSRKWLIRDAFGKVSEIEGEGIVGKKPKLEPGESFTYTSYCPIRTPSGEMDGIFFTRDSQMTEYDLKVPIFTLSNPEFLN